ncbi:MAG: VWA domain-containing protein [Actinomycetota bacterium]|nr:VWA domain-containing protein [Actinomycetota bacterium]
MGTLNFKWPLALWALALIPLIGIGYARWVRQGRAAAERFARPAMHPNVLPVRPRWRRHVPVALYVCALAALLGGVARPQAAFSVPRERATVMLVMDASNSMLARDVEPNRLEAARAAARAFLDAVPPGFQVGVVGFAKNARVFSRATTDRSAVSSALDDLETRSGTAIGEGVWRALIEQAPQLEQGQDVPPTALVLLSDGNNTAGEIDPIEAARRANQAGVKIYSVAVGLEIPPPGMRGPKPPDHSMLQQVAAESGGRFFSAASAADLTEVYRSLGSSIATVTEQREVTAAFVGVGLAFLIAGAAVAALWFNRIP